MSGTDFWDTDKTRDDNPVVGSGGRRRQKQKQKKQKRKRRGSGAAAVASLLFLFVVVGGGGYFGYTELKAYMQPPDYTGEGTGKVTVEVKDGDSTSVIAGTLEKAEVVKSAKAFVNAAEDAPEVQSIQPGFYVMRLRMSAEAAVTLILSPEARSGVIDVPEGLWASEIYQRLSKTTKIPVSAFKKVDPRKLGLPAAAKGEVEGYLFPGRYDLPPDATAQQLLKMMVDRFRQEIKRVNLAEGAEEQGRTVSEIMVIASIVQAEAGKPEDQAKISRVVYNRLKADKALQFDTPVMYAHGERTIDVRYGHLEIDSPYNVYKHLGLPPGPISNPGLDAIKAAIDPQPGKWMFFVATDPENHITEFGVTEEDFARLKKKFDKWLEKNRD
ncbi:endolytic transglycosylase MltG [Actinocorallia populi]|uniref:endolytic transglycosylase MltG n=1 Tax=Actinocorallia populi TaxID=2079200 RepID=UPI000D090962|nr:endolytic transglycosylase MltG [Actinocorallia populi]